MVTERELRSDENLFQGQAPVVGDKINVTCRGRSFEARVIWGNWPGRNEHGRQMWSSCSGLKKIGLEHPKSKTGHCDFQNRPLEVKTGQYPHPRCCPKWGASVLGGGGKRPKWLSALVSILVFAALIVNTNKSLGAYVVPAAEGSLTAGLL